MKLPTLPHFPTIIISPTLPHRLSRTMGERLIQQLREHHDVNAWAFLMEDHLLEKVVAGGFQNDPVAAKEDLKRQLPGDVRDAIYPMARPLTSELLTTLSGSSQDKPKRTQDDDDEDEGGMGGGLSMDITQNLTVTQPESVSPAKKLIEEGRRYLAQENSQHELLLKLAEQRRLKKAEEQKAQAKAKTKNTPHIPLPFPAQRPHNGPRQGVIFHTEIVRGSVFLRGLKS